MVLAELMMLALSFGAPNLWKGSIDDVSDFKAFSDLETESQANFGPKSLYDLMQHFPLDKDIECPTSDARFRYPGQCTRYITCRNFQAHIRSCPPGMKFDHKYNHCRLGFEVICDDEAPFPLACGTNEVYKKCGTGCERTCNDLHRQIECEVECIEGCRCRLGYVRNGAGKCVNPEACENANSLYSILKSK